MIFSVTILGSNSAIPTVKRNPTAQLVNHNERLFLLDCAEGTQVQLRKIKIRIQRISHIFISHLHGDHFFGLIGLISSMHLLGRNKSLNIYGPAKLEEILKIQLEASETNLNYELVFHPLVMGTTSVIYEDEKLTISTIPLNHSIPTLGFLFREKLGKRRLIKGKIAELNIPVQNILPIKNGADFIDENGMLHKNSEVTENPLVPRTYAFCSDTSYYEPVIPIIEGADLLYHETTFMQDMAKVAAEKFHSTTIEAGTIASKANVKKLIIGHFSMRYDILDYLLDETKTAFSNVELAIDGKSFEI
jgi:ribonuclease Z